MKYVKMLIAATIAAALAISDFVLVQLSRLPFLPDFRSVSYAMLGFEKVQRRLQIAQQVANERAESFSALADRYDGLAAAAEDEADRAARVQMRLSKLLD